ncbi:MAG: hypothetical protein COT17_06005 [Elusimicrobia bacterium CG08_land_8_20_14_0_20_51_18]|nr:MAG: hypothetical protein COT17_06005 [Elusimicrobia bacterium CG08_land_8_20_14_0_20_51_18]
MKKSIVTLTVVLFSGMIAGASEFSIESLKSGAFNIDVSKVEAPEVPVPAKPAKQEPAPVGQDLIYKFQNVKNELWRFENDTTWLRNDLNSLERDARNLSQGHSNAFFGSDLRRMSMKISGYQNDAQRIAYDVQNLLTPARKDKELNRIARDMEWDARDLLNRFQFDIENAAQNLESTVTRIDPKIIGYDAQWQARDISRNARNVAWKLWDLSWDVQSLMNKTQP